MRTAAIIISIVVAILVAATISGLLGVLIALAMVGYQVIYDYGRSETVRARRTLRGAYMTDIARTGVFLIPLVVALASGAWIGVAATVVVLGATFICRERGLMTAVVEFKRRNGGSSFDLSADATGLPSGADALRMLSEPLAGGDPLAKRVPQGALLKVLENGPFEPLP